MRDSTRDSDLRAMLPRGMDHIPSEVLGACVQALAAVYDPDQGDGTGVINIAVHKRQARVRSHGGDPLTYDRVDNSN